MKRRLFLLSFLLVLFAQAFNIASGVFTGCAKVEVTEKGKAEKEADNESDFEKEKKDKIFQSNIIPYVFLALPVRQDPHPETKISSLALDTEINPPDSIFSC